MRMIQELLGLLDIAAGLLKKLGPKVIPKIIDALAMSDKSHTMVFVDILASHVSDKTLKFYQEGLSDGGERVVSGTAWALSSSNNYTPHAPLTT